MPFWASVFRSQTVEAKAIRDSSYLSDLEPCRLVISQNICPIHVEYVLKFMIGVVIHQIVIISTVDNL